MTKKKIIAIVLAIVIGISAVAVPLIIYFANKNDNKAVPISSVKQVESYKDEYAQVLLAGNMVSKNDERYKTLKSDSISRIDSLLNSQDGKVKAIIDNFAKEVLSKSNVTTKTLSTILSRVEEFLIARNNLLFFAKDRYEFYVSKNFTESLCNLMGDLYNRFSSGVWNEKNGIINVLTTMLSAETTLVTVFTTLYEAEKTVITTISGREKDYNNLVLLLKDLYSKAKKLSKIEKTSILVRTITNVVGASQTLSLVKEQFGSEQQADIDEVVNVLNNEIGISSPVVKTAYENFIIPIVDNLLKTVSGFFNNISFELVFDFARHLKDKDIKEMFKDIKEMNYLGLIDLLLIVLNKNIQVDMLEVTGALSKAITSNNISNAEAEKIVDNAKTLNRTGIGYYMEKYFDLYRYGKDFIGHFIGKINSQDIGDALYCLTVEKLNSNIPIELEKVRVLEYKLVAEKFLTVYNSYKYKTQLEASINKNDNSTVKQFPKILENITKLNNLFTRQYVTKQNGNLDNSKINQTHIDNSKIYLEKILLAGLDLGQTNFNSLTNCNKEVLRYVAPFEKILNVVKGYVGAIA